MIRVAKIKDIPVILELLKQVNLVHHEARPDIFKIATKYSEKELEIMVLDELNPIFVYTDSSDLPLGYAFCITKQFNNHPMMTDIKTLYIDDLCVNKDNRRTGIGKALYEYVINFAKKNNYYNVTLNVWASNPEALKFYESLGLAPQKIYMETILK